MPFRWLDMMMAVICFTVGGCGREGARMSQTQELSYPLISGARGSLQAKNGKITILGWDKQEVRVKITKTVWAATRERAEARFDEVQIDLDHEPDRFSARETRFRIESRIWDFLDPDRWAYGWREVRVDYDLTVPRKLTLDLENEEGDAEVREIEGEISVELKQGRLSLENITTSRLHVKAGEGDLRGEKIQSPPGTGGRITLRTEEGNVALEEVTAQDINVDAQEGHIRVRHLQATNVDLFTDEGDIDGELELLGAGQSRLRANEGDVILTLVGAPSVSVKAVTREGMIRTDYPLRVTEFDGGQRAEGTIGIEPPAAETLGCLEISTEAGNILLRKMRNGS